MSKEEEHLFQLSKSYWVCKKLIDHDNEKVRDHCHVTGKFRGAAHWSSNINFQLTKKIPIIFHNLRGYDSHLIFCGLNKSDVKINLISNGLEKYMAFFLSKNLVFIDSMQFMNSSLDKLVKNLSDEDFKYLVEEDDHISFKDYLTCEKIWDKFDMKNMGDYHDHYWKKILIILLINYIIKDIIVLLLADVFEKFTDTCLKFYGLDPCYYFISLGLSWDAMLKMTGVKVKQISDIDKYLLKKD